MYHSGIYSHLQILMDANEVAKHVQIALTPE